MLGADSSSGGLHRGEGGACTEGFLVLLERVPLLCLQPRQQRATPSASRPPSEGGVNAPFTASYSAVGSEGPWRCGWGAGSVPRLSPAF